MPVHYEVDDHHVALITIDRPEAKNAMDPEHFWQLKETWKRFAEDPRAWTAIVTGVGDAFCTGADLKRYFIEMREQQARLDRGEISAAEAKYHASDGVRASLRGVRLYKPVIAAVNGVCVAGGMEMMLGTDLRLAVPEATFGVTEPRRGLFAGGGSTVRLPRQIGHAAAMEILLVADRISAERALQLGLLNEVVPRAELLERARWYAGKINENSPFAVQKTKESVQRSQLVTAEEGYDIERAISRQVFDGPDALEGPAAFAEKRPPRWNNPPPNFDHGF